MLVWPCYSDRLWEVKRTARKKLEIEVVGNTKFSDYKRNVWNGINSYTHRKCWSTGTAKSLINEGVHEHADLLLE